MCCSRLGAGRTSALKKGHSVSHAIRVCSHLCASHISAITMNSSLISDLPWDVLYCVFDSLECNRCLTAVSRTSRLLKARYQRRAWETLDIKSKTRLMLPTDQMQCACYEVDEAATAHTRKRPRTPPSRDWPHLIDIVKTLVARPDLRRQVKHLRIVAYHPSLKTRRKTGFQPHAIPDQVSEAVDDGIDGVVSGHHNPSWKSALAFADTYGSAYSAVVLALVASTVVRLSIYESRSRSSQSMGLESFHKGSLAWMMTALSGHVRDKIFLSRNAPTGGISETQLQRWDKLTTLVVKGAVLAELVYAVRGLGNLHDLKLLCGQVGDDHIQHDPIPLRRLELDRCSFGDQVREGLEDSLAHMPKLTTFILKVDQSWKFEDRDVPPHEVLEALSSSPGVVSVTITFYIQNAWSAWTTVGTRLGDIRSWSCRRLHMDTWSLSKWWKACFWHGGILMPRSTSLPETNTMPTYRLADMLPANLEQLWLHVYPEAFPRLAIELTHLIGTQKDRFQALELLVLESTEEWFEGERRAVMELAGRCTIAGVDCILLVNDAQLRFLESRDRRLQVWQRCRAPTRDWRSSLVM
ncbi:hypothetical protein BDZ85DRAFT_257826 [Elsinoe ampelina]|uniref:F-box domain-containing protein n=1 Tax=Elsinoe ampelina TaxID=302913 RepID=A0A6A6GJ65_9PEZI|nr:hypothetical protein BDZ85DRAFT_257826 [Elsinoe ampelina]